MDVTLASVLLDRVQAYPEKIAFEYLRSNGESAGLLSYGELLIRATAIAAYLQREFLPGERLLLIFPPGLDFIASFFGCLLAAMVPVPLAPPGRHDVLRAGMVAADAAAGGILGAGFQFERWQRTVIPSSRAAEIPWIRADLIETGLSAAWQYHSALASDLAMLQYTSGSTRNPRGVALNHGNLLSNSELIRRRFGTGPHTIGVSWLPFHHDMGLIGNIIQPLYAGGTAVLMAPTTFLHRPQLWLSTISSHRATVSGGPNFAYEHCLARITEADKVGFDLSTWEVAYCGAEPIKASTLKAFVDRFSSVGFSHKTFLPCYGLAEATLMVCSVPRDEAPQIVTFDTAALSQGIARRSLPGDPSCDLVACGTDDSGQRVTIVDPAQRRQLDQGYLGEIWVQGAGIAEGYYRRPEEHPRFHATLPGVPGDWLQTGDLGFIFEGQIFVVGRSHDQLVIQGRNLFAHDIEWGLADIDPGLGRCVAFAGKSTDQLIVIQELMARRASADYPRIVREIRRRITTLMGIELHTIALVSLSSIPVTTSGKPRRLWCRELFLKGELSFLMQWQQGDRLPSIAGPKPHPTADEIRVWLIDKLASRLHLPIENINPFAPFFDSGLTSLDAVELCEELEHWLEQPLSPTIIFSYPTVNALSDRLGRVDLMSLKRGEASSLSPSPDPDLASMSSEALEKWIDLLYEANKRNV